MGPTVGPTWALKAFGQPPEGLGKYSTYLDLQFPGEENMLLVTLFFSHKPSCEKAGIGKFCGSEVGN